MWGKKLLERLSDAHAPGMTILTLSEINTKVHMILLAQLKPDTTTAAWQEVFSPKRLIATGHYFSQPSKPNYAKPFG